MKKLIAIGLAALLLLSLGAGVALAQDEAIPASSAAFTTGTGNMVGLASIQGASEATILTAMIKTGTPKDLVIDVSAETFLGTAARLDGDTALNSDAKVEIAVFVDNTMIDPGWITFDSRLLQLDGDLTHTIHYSGEDLGITIDDHWIEVYIETAAAHAFNFCARSVGSGVHDIAVKAKITTNADAGLESPNKHNNTPNIYAGIGNASAVVSEVMLKVID